MSARKKHRTIHEYLRYLKGELSQEERHTLERNLEADPFEKEAMEGFEMISAGELEEDILSLHSRLRKRQQRRRRVALYSIAATVASLLVVGTIFINIYDFNPETDREAVQAEESQLMDKSPEPGEAAASENPDLEEAFDEELDEALDEELEISEKRDAKGPAAAKKLEVPAIKEEVPVPDQRREMLAEEHEEVAGVAAPQMAREEIPEMAEEMAPAPEADEIMAVEAAPTRRQKRAESRAKTAPSALDQGQAEQLLSAQVSGVVISAEDMGPLPGATVMVEGVASGYVSDMEGRFSVPAGDKAQTTVIASYVGMVTEEYQLDKDQENRVVMQPDQANLDEVVVVASGAPNEKFPVSAVQKVQVNQQDYYSEYKGAEPVGGIEAYKMYMEKNIRFPAGDTLSKREVVVLKFNVSPDGNLSGIMILRSPGQAFTEEALRLLEEGPSWNPSRGENGTTDDEVRMRIVFKK